jgi:hypothetical protein
MVNVRMLALALALLAFSDPPASALAADRVSGVLTRTFVIIEDTDLVGDVICEVGTNPCFSFGASHVELRLNGFTVTGRADPVTACGGAVFANEVGVTSNGQHDVKVRGPGLVHRFRDHGVLITGGSRNARVEGITAASNCRSGIRVTAGTFDTLVEGNTLVRNGATTPGSSCGGI